MNGLPSILDAKLTYLYNRKGGHLVKYTLGTTLRLLREMHVDPTAIPCVHIAGTSGKGSTAAMLESALRSSGLKTALYTSPHLIRFNERIRIAGLPIPDDALNALLDEAEAADARQAASPGQRPGTFFELTTAIAFSWFLRSQVDLAVIETGLGGRLDSTNVLSPLLAIITDLGLEHTAILGPTLEKIAAEKAGIIKPARPVLLNPQPRPAQQVLESIAASRNSPLLRADQLVSIRRLAMDHTGQKLSVETPDGPWKPFTLPLLGDFQLRNAALAIAALHLLHTLGYHNLSQNAIRTGLSRVRWPGRCQIVSQQPLIIVDVGHNPHEAAALAQFIRSYRNNRPLTLISGLLADKDALGYFRLLRPVADHLFLVPIESERNMPPEKLRAAARQAGFSPQEAPFELALSTARAWAQQNNGILLIAGSLLLGAAALFSLGVEV